MRLRKIGAILAGAAMLGATLAPLISAGDQPQKSFWVNEDGSPAAMIVVGDSAAASDVVSASLIAAKVGAMAVKVETMQAPATVYSDMAINIPLAYMIPSWEETIPGQIINLDQYGAFYTDAYYPPTMLPALSGAGLGEGTVYAYKTWGVTTHWTPSDNSYVIHDVGEQYAEGSFKYFNGVRVEYTLNSLWFYDENSTAWFFTLPDGQFQPWETHEEIQIRFDDLFMVGGKEFQLTGVHFQDHNADLAGGDVVPVGTKTWAYDPTTFPYSDDVWASQVDPDTLMWRNADVPGLIYRIDNIRRPRQKEITGYYLWYPYWKEWVDMQSEFLTGYQIVEPYSILRKWIPKIHIFGKDYKVVDATFLWDYDLRYRMQDPNWELGKAGFTIITGEPRFYVEQYIYKDAPVTLDGYEINVKDVDVDHNKVFANITTPSGDTVEMWMILDPLHGFSATPQLMSQTGEATEYNGPSNNDVWFWVNDILYRDNAGHSHLEYEYPVFALDGIATMIGAGGTVGAMFNVYTVSDIVEFTTQLCCVPYVEEPNNYSLFIDQQSTLDPCMGNFFSSGLIEAYAINGDPEGTASTLPYKGTWDSIDSHCTTAGFLLPPSELGTTMNLYSYEHYIEAVPDWQMITGGLAQYLAGGKGYADRDPNDYLWNYEDFWDARKSSHWFTYNSRTVYTDPDWGTETSELGGFKWGGDYPLDGADYMWEMNFALCESLEAVRCTTKWVINGPNDYFRIEMSDITWDDDGNGIMAIWNGEAWVTDQNDDGIDFKVIMEVSSGSYTQTTPVSIDPTQIVKLDVEVTDEDMAAYNLVLVGGPVANILVKRIVDSGVSPNDGSAKDWMISSSGDFKLYTNPFGKGKDVLVVAGANREETRKAAEELVSGMG